MRWYTCTLCDHDAFETGNRHEFARHMFDVHTEDAEGVDRHEVVRRLLAQHGVDEIRSQVPYAGDVPRGMRRGPEDEGDIW